ncbi:hypothetical protein [Pararobbsia silviterrae]|uniref:hypothetical protein n=1 Tax=Pararobbsia silviterrae TaxID=1792498 RepID=UPI001314A3A1|nr:hypothetical protein [Pararobbsia silviterrae]
MRVDDASAPSLSRLVALSHLDPLALQTWRDRHDTESLAARAMRIADLDHFESWSASCALQTYFDALPADLDAPSTSPFIDLARARVATLAEKVGLDVPHALALLRGNPAGRPRASRLNDAQQLAFLDLVATPERERTLVQLVDAGVMHAAGLSTGPYRTVVHERFHNYHIEMRRRLRPRADDATLIRDSRRALTSDDFVRRWFKYGYCNTHTLGAWTPDINWTFSRIQGPVHRPVFDALDLSHSNMDDAHVFNPSFAQARLTGVTMARSVIQRDVALDQAPWQTWIDALRSAGVEGLDVARCVAHTGRVRYLDGGEGRYERVQLPDRPARGWRAHVRISRWLSSLRSPS